MYKMKKNKKTEDKKIIAVCRVSKVGQKIVTIPKNTSIQDGDIIIIKKLEINE